MTAAARKSATPRTVQQLEAELGRSERNLVEAQRANTVARTALGGHIASGDAEEIAECRREISATAARVKELTEEMGAVQDAIRFAQAQDRAGAALAAYGNLKKMVADSRAEVEALGDSIIAFANALKAARTGLESLDAQMRKSGVTPDPYILLAKLIGVVDVALHLETDGVVGNARTLENRDQLRKSGFASLHRIAKEFDTLTMRQIKSALNVTRD
jgi:hypothetical protein